jgi:HEAT repeat protein
MEAVGLIHLVPDSESRLLSLVRRETNYLVRTLMIEELGAPAEVMSPAGIALLEEVAAGDRSPFVRAAAMASLFERRGGESRSFLASRVDVEKSATVRAALATLLLALGDLDSLDVLERLLKSRREVIRRSVANLSRQYDPAPVVRAQVLEMLKQAVTREDDEGAIGDFRAAIGHIEALAGRSRE